MLKHFAILFYLFVINSIICEYTSNLQSQRSFSRDLTKISVVQRIYGGEYFARGKYPWMVTLMEDKDDQIKYFCGGVLISNRKVLCAAHCIHPKGERRKSLQDIIVLLGVHDLKEIYEVDRITKIPDKIFVHPNWNHNSVSYDYDIAVIFFAYGIHFSDFIKPIHLWTFDIDPTATQGIVIGYGKSEDETIVHETTPKELKIPIISNNEDCYEKDPSFARISSKRTFCAGAADGSGPCLGDSGHGLFIKYRKLFYLRGLVSSSFLNGQSCDTSKYVVFTNVLKYKQWIENPSRKHESYTIQSTQSPQLEYKIQCDDSFCGLMAKSSGLIQGGEMSQRKQFPWMAIIKRFHYQFWSYHGGSGSLITHKHVIAHSGSVSDLDSSNNFIAVKTRSIKILLGTIKYDDLSETGSYEVKVESIINHSNARQVLSFFDANQISIITLNREVAFTEFIRPVCLWPFGDDLNDIVGRDAYVVGYGVDHTGRDSLTRKHVRMTVIDENEDCRNTFQNQFVFKNEAKLFCAQSSGRDVPCANDSQLFMKIGSHWYLKGFGSSIFFFRNKTCDHRVSTLYEDIAQYVPWIQNQIQF